MQIDNTFSGGLKVAIVPAQFSIADERNATSIACYIDFDNMKDFARIVTHIMCDEGSCMLTKNIEITGEDYRSWDGTNEQAVEYAASKLNLIITPAPAEGSIIDE